ncbi:hypothetical protein [Rickettsiella massiliensis]|uniref:hypothetical protein n=1 Tax=Rickettsiella massiliensis TaxID=676517 RepID=UPI000299EE76|nr:hypothetical protein [Rickettsiella massiliensis]
MIFLEKNIRRQFIFIDSIYSKISFIQEKIRKVIESYVSGKQWLGFKILLSKNSSEDFLEKFKKTTGIGVGIENYYFPNVYNIKSITNVLIFYFATVANAVQKEKLFDQLNEFMIEFKVEQDKNELEEPTITELSLKDFISFGYLVLITAVYHDSQSVACELKESLAYSKGYVTNIILLQGLRDIHHKKQKVEAIKDKFLRDNYASCQHFLEAKHAALDEVTLLFDVIDKAIEILHKESNLTSSLIWQIIRNGCVLNTEETIFSPHWNETVRDFSALQDHLKNEHDYWIKQQALIKQRVFIFKEKEVLSKSIASELNWQKKGIPSSDAYTDLLGLCRILYQNIEKTISCIKSIGGWKGGQREKDQLFAQFSSALGQLAAHPKRLLKQLQTLDLSNELNDEMITPVLRLERLKRFTERFLKDSADQSQKKKMKELIELLNKSIERANQLSSLVKNVTENYRAINQRMEATLKSSKKR